MNDLNGRKAKVKSWLNHFANELYTYQQCFLCNLISCDDIGKYHFDDICNKIFEQNNIEIHTIDEIFYEIAIEYNIYSDEEYDIYNNTIIQKINENK